ncbi:MAG: VOC family protein [Gemmatimonadetes bacterium]|nr:VOC family protein [Gemmatimonadota bacterium]
MKAVFLAAVPYADDALALPVADVAAAIPYYEQAFGFRVAARRETPHPAAVLHATVSHRGSLRMAAIRRRRGASSKSTTSTPHSPN